MTLFVKERNIFMEWDEYTYSNEDIMSEAYKASLGGSKSEWKLRGKFQLEFMKVIGLKPHHEFLDIGCGPLRAGIHFIEYLDKRKYFGFD